MEEELILLGRILFVAVFAGSAMAHLTQTEQMGAYAESRGVANGALMTRLTGIQMALGSIMVLFGILPDLGALLLAAFVVPTAFIMHAFWKEQDPQAQQMEQIQFMKDLSLGGGALVLAGLFALADGNLAYTITDSLF